MYLNLIILFVIGLFCGSIFVKIGFRTPQKETILTKSRCNSCGHELSLLEQIPIISYILQRGKCKHCYKKIGFIYPLVELMTGTLFALTYYSFMNYENPFFQVLYGLIFVSSLIIIMISDIKYMLIPNKILIVFTMLTLFLKLFIGINNNELTNFMDVGYEVIIMAIDAGIMFVIMLIIKKIGKILFKKEALGGGDVKMMAYVAMLLGYKLSIVIIFFASFIALPIFIYNAYRKSETMLAYGPFLAVATLILFLAKIDFESLLSLIRK